MTDLEMEFARRTVRSREIHERSKDLIPMEVIGTVDMPYPIYLAEGHGARVIDVDGNEYIDLSMGFGCHVLGHAHPSVVGAVQDAATRGVQFGIHTPHQEPLARLVVEACPCAESVLFCNSGTEATMYAIRLARAHSGKTKIGFFEGAYHGAHDIAVFKTDDSSARNRPQPTSKGAGVPAATLEEILLLPYRDESAFDLIRQYADELAVVVIEPVQGSNPTLQCEEFLAELVEVAKQCGVLLLFDEVITGFRLSLGGAQSQFKLTPDLATYGKTVGGGLPIGAVAGRADVMARFNWHKHKDIEGQVFAGGTFGGNPLSMCAGAATVEYLRDHPEVYTHLARHGERFEEELGQFCEDKELPVQVMTAHSMIHLRFQDGPVKTTRDVDRSLARAEKEFYTRLLLEGILVPGDHLALTSAMHTSADIDKVLQAMYQSLEDNQSLAHH